MKKFNNNVIFNENGATAIEYSLVAALISVGIISSTRVMGGRVRGVFNNISDTIGISNSSSRTNTSNAVVRTVGSTDSVGAG